jgi:hypothetical protein
VFTETPVEICAKTGSVEEGAGDPGTIGPSESNCCITTTTTTTTNAGFLYYRTQNGETTPYAGDGCILDLDQSCKLQHQNPNPAIVTSGDRVINSPGSGYFNGGGETYRLQISTATLGDPSYVVVIDGLGFVNVVTLCT